MLDDIRDECRLAIDPGRLEDIVQELSGGPDEGRTGEILPVSRLLTNEHPSCGYRPDPEHRLGGARPQVARSTGVGGRSDRTKVDRAICRSLMGSDRKQLGWDLVDDGQRRSWLKG